MTTGPLEMLVDDQRSDGLADKLIELDNNLAALLFPEMLKPYFVAVDASAGLCAVWHEQGGHRSPPVLHASSG